jgi:hypothetical protein
MLVVMTVAVAEVELAVWFGAHGQRDVLCRGPW